MLESKVKSRELRRSRRISQMVNYEKTKRDELTGRGLVYNIDDIKFIEFETLEDMRLYDSVAAKMGNLCCANFNEFSFPFRGFSEEESNSSNKYLFQFMNMINKKELQSVVAVEKTFVADGDDIFGVKQGSSMLPKSFKSAKSRRTRTSISFRGSSTCGPHGKQSCAPCSAAAKSYRHKLNGVNDSLLTPSPSPDDSFDNLTFPTVASGDSELDKYVDDLLLTPVGSPSSREQELHCSNERTYESNSWDKIRVDSSTIPYIFKCNASNECQNSKDCANASSRFTLCIKITPGKGRALSKFAIKYLECNESGIVDRVSANIAASAVDLPDTTFLLPLEQSQIDSLFPQLSLTYSSLSNLNTVPNTALKTFNVDKPSKFSDNKRSSLCANNASPVLLKMVVDTKRMESIQYNIQDNWTVDRSSRISPLSSTICATNLDSFRSSVSHHSGNDDKGTHAVPSFGTCPFNMVESNNSLDSEYQETDYETLPKRQRLNIRQEMTLNRSPLKSRYLVRSGSITVTDYSPSEKLPDFKPTEPVQDLLSDEHANTTVSMVGDSSFKQFGHSDLTETTVVRSTYVQPIPENKNHPMAQTGVDLEKTPNSNPCSSDAFCPRIVSTVSLNGSPKARFSGLTMGDVQTKQGEHNSASLCCPLHPKRRRPVIQENNASKFESIIDLTKSERNVPLQFTGAIQQLRKAKKRKQSSLSALQSDEVIVIDDDYHGVENNLELNREIPNIEKMVSGSSCTLDSSTTVSTMDSQKVTPILNSNQNIIDLTEGSAISESLHNGQTSLPKQHPAPNSMLSSNLKEKVIDLTEEGEKQTSIAEVNPNVRSKLTATTVEVLNREEVENHSPKPLVSQQELAVMCTTIPTLGYIKVMRFPSGELMLNESFTARVYKHFEDLKALNIYLNQRFEKMHGVRNRGPLNWILATSGVIKLKKVQPINPKVWFHPNDYILTKLGPDDVLTAIPLNLPKMKSSPGINRMSMSCLLKHVPPPPPETRKIPLKYTTLSRKGGCLIPYTKCDSSTVTNNLLSSSKTEQKSAQLVPDSLSKQDCEQIDPTFTENKPTISSSRVNTVKPGPSFTDANTLRPHNVSPTCPQNGKQIILLQNDVTMPSGQVSTDIKNNTQSKLSTSQRMAVLLDKPPNFNHILTSPNQVAGNLPVATTPPSGTVLKNIHVKASKFQNDKIAITNTAPTKHPTSSTQDQNRSKRVVILKKIEKCSQTNQLRSNGSQKNIEYKPSTPQVSQTFSLNNNRTTILTKAQLDLHGNAAYRSNTGQLLGSTRRLSQPLITSNNGLVLAKDQVNMQKSNHSQIGTSQKNMQLPTKAGLVQLYKMSPGNTLSANPHSLISNNGLLINTNSGQSNNQESSDNIHSNVSEPPVRVLLDSQTLQSMDKQLIPIVPGTSSSEDVLSRLSTAHSAVRAPDRRIAQPTSLPKSVILNTPAGSRKVAFVSASQSAPARFIPIKPTSHQGTIFIKSTVAQSVSQMKQSLNQTEPSEKTGFPEAMIYFSSEGKCVKGIPVRKFPLRVTKMDPVVTSNPVTSPQSCDADIPSNKRTVELSRSCEASPPPNKRFELARKSNLSASQSCNTDSPLTNKPVEFVRRSSLPLMFYSTRENKNNVQPAPLKLHWAAFNLRKPSQPQSSCEQST